MRQFILLFVSMLAFVTTWVAPAPVQAAGGVQDNAKLFTSATVSSANDLIRQIRTSDHRDVLVVTFPSIPDDRQAELTSKGKQRFYAEWAEDLGKEKGISGVVILIVKNPGHLEIAVGNKTRQGIFTIEDRDELDHRMLARLKEHKYDDAVLEGLQFIKTTMDRHPAKGAVAPPTNTPYTPPTSTPPVVHQSTGSGVGGLICLGVGILVVVVLIISVVNRNRSYGGGYGAPPPGGYPPGYSGPYPQGGGYGGGGYGGGGYGGGGGGFGRGLLGGLLGGALGAWGYEKFNQGGQSTNYIPQQPGTTGGSPDNTPDQTDTSFSGTGGDFDSGSSSGPADSGGGSDFGGGGDSGGGGGGDFGGGGDSGGGGGDSGGGGDF
jgi:uncharacterized membrane protein YgcG